MMTYPPLITLNHNISMVLPVIDMSQALWIARQEIFADIRVCFWPENEPSEALSSVCY
jgi:hypothetical protein